MEKILNSEQVEILRKNFLMKSVDSETKEVVDYLFEDYEEEKV